nr:AIM24 family protein [Paenibacillus lentus]
MLSGQAVTFKLDPGEIAHVLHPGQIIAFRGSGGHRSDKLMNIQGMYRKRKLIRADIQGPCQFVASLPPSITMNTIRFTDGSDLLYDFKHLFFYTEGVEMETRILSMKNMMITRDAIKMKFSGRGFIGILTQGQVLEMPLDPEEPIYVEAGSVIAYPENAKLELSVYGNHLASQHMRYQWKMTGHGHVLIQAGSGNRELERDLQSGDGVVKRFLREVIPFGGVFIK